MRGTPGSEPHICFGQTLLCNVQPQPDLQILLLFYCNGLPKSPQTQQP